MAGPTCRDIFAVLCNEPFFLDVEKVGKLTPYQIQEIYFAKRTSSGAIEMTGPATEISMQDAHRMHYRKMGLPDWMADREWRQVVQNG